MPKHANFKKKKKLQLFEVAWRAGKLLLALTSKRIYELQSKRRADMRRRVTSWLYECLFLSPSGLLTPIKYTVRRRSEIPLWSSAEDWHFVCAMSRDKNCKPPCWWWIEDQICRIAQCCSELCAEISFISSCSEPDLNQKMCLYLWKITQGAATVSTQFIFPLLSVENKIALPRGGHAP